MPPEGRNLQSDNDDDSTGAPSPQAGGTASSLRRVISEVAISTGGAPVREYTVRKSSLIGYVRIRSKEDRPKVASLFP